MSDVNYLEGCFNIGKLLRLIQNKKEYTDLGFDIPKELLEEIEQVKSLIFDKNEI